MSRRAPTLPLYLWARAFALQTMGDYDGAERAWLDLGLKTRDASFQALMHAGLADLAQTRGKLAEAERQTRLGMGVSHRRGLPGSALGDAADLALQYVLFRGDSAGGLRIVETALQRHPLDSVPALDRPGAELALVYAVAGQRARARQLLAAYEAQVPEGIRRGRWAWYRARGWVALAEGHATEAIAAFAKGRNSPSCVDCGAWDEGVAFERASLPDSAIAAYRRAVGRGTVWKPFGDAWGLAPSLKRLGELYEERGDKAHAIEHYSRFLKLWKDADPVLQPTVREVRGRLARLAGEGQ